MKFFETLFVQNRYLKIIFLCPHVKKIRDNTQDEKIFFCVDIISLILIARNQKKKRRNY